MLLTVTDVPFLVCVFFLTEAIYLCGRLERVVRLSNIYHGFPDTPGGQK